VNQPPVRADETRRLAIPYVDVAGLKTWHEVSGEGDPVVLLHGGFVGASSWAGQAPALAGAGYRVYVPERRGHGHTPDVAGPVTYSVMADDTIAYLDQVIGRPAHLIGWSDGAVVALLVAQRRPDLAAGLVLIGQYLNSAGRAAGGLLDDILGSNSEIMGFLRQEHDRVSPDGPEHFPVFHEKMLTMFRAEPELNLAALAGIDLPALVLQGDRDEVTVQHSAAVAEMLPQGRLAVLPGSHLLPIESPGLVNELLLAFLRGGFPARP
jgi:pimeloyl-ACP methyl ester carboxylesterase